MSHRVAIVDGKSAVTTADLEHLALDFLAAGVVGTDDYKVEQQVTPDMTVKVNTGKAYVFNSTGSEAFRTELDASANVTIGANVSGNPRIDAIVIKIDKSATPNSGGTNVATLVAVQGTPAASPSAPLDAAIQTAIGAGNPFYRLANVTVANGAVSISSANISGTRSQCSLGGSASSDGWITAADTWTYASAATFTIAGVDRTAVYTKGTRLKFTQSATTKYAVVVGSSFSTDTTVTIAVNNDYTIANAAITSPSYSYQTNPQGYPGWFGYDPTWTGFSAAITRDVFYKIDGRTVTLLFGAVNGTSNSATFDFTLPVAPAASNSGGYDAHPIAVMDSGSWQNSPGVIGLLDANTTAKVGKTISSIGGNVYGGFTSSSNKGLTGTITYKY